MTGPGQILQELAGNGRGRQIISAVFMVLITTMLSTGVSFWWSEQADAKLERLATVAEARRSELAAQLARELENWRERVADRIMVLEDRLQRMEAVDGTIQATTTLTLREQREMIERRLTIEAAGDTTQRIDAQMDDILDRLREVERMVYSNQSARPR